MLYMYSYDPFGIFLESLNEEEIMEVEKRAAHRFFNQVMPPLNGDYVVVNLNICVGSSSADALKADAALLGIDPAVYTDRNSRAQTPA